MPFDSRNVILKAVGLLFILTAASAAHSASYKIEMLLFLNQDGAAQSSEYWPDDPGLPSTADALPLQGSGSPYREAGRSLNAHRLQLKQTGRYKPLLHVAWIQPVTRKGKKLFFELPGRGSPLVGTIRMSRGRFLHADLDVLYRTWAGGGESQRSYRLKEKRRMRSDELHYVDHPALGVLIRATPIKAAAPTEQQDAPSADEENQSAG